MFKSIAIVAVVMSLLGTSTVNGSDGAGTTSVADEAAVSLELNTALGTGCLPGSTAVVPTKDPNSFGVIYRSFTVFGDDYQNCQLVVKVSAPTNITYTLYAVSRGYAHIDSGAYATLQTTSYLTGSSTTMGVKFTIKGPYNDFWEAHSDVDGLYWAPCGSDRFFNINNTIRVDGPKTSVMSLASSSFNEDIMTVVHVRWRSC